MKFKDVLNQMNEAKEDEKVDLKTHDDVHAFAKKHSNDNWKDDDNNQHVYKLKTKGHVFTKHLKNAGWSYEKTNYPSEHHYTHPDGHTVVSHEAGDDAIAIKSLVKKRASPRPKRNPHLDHGYFD